MPSALITTHIIPLAVAVLLGLGGLLHSSGSMHAMINIDPINDHNAALQRWSHDGHIEDLGVR